MYSMFSGISNTFPRQSPKYNLVMILNGNFSFIQSRDISAENITTSLIFTSSSQNLIKNVLVAYSLLSR